LFRKASRKALGWHGCGELTRPIEFAQTLASATTAGPRYRLGPALPPRAALFLAGQAFREYRRAGGTRTGVLGDLFIGAHAAVLGCGILTRDAARYRTYFPTVELLTPRGN